MATRMLATANSGAVEFSIDFNDTNNQITTVRIVNNGSFGTMTATLFNKVTGLPVFGPISRGFDTGTFEQNVTGANLSMDVGAPSKYHPDGISEPFHYTVTWGSV